MSIKINFFKLLSLFFDDIYRNIVILRDLRLLIVLVRKRKMEIRSSKLTHYPPLIKDLVKELLKDDFVHFKILCANEVHHFNKETDCIIEFQETYVKETSANGDMLYIAYPDIFRVKLYRDMHQYMEDQKKDDAFNDDDLWTGNRIQF